MGHWGYSDRRTSEDKPGGEGIRVLVQRRQDAPHCEGPGEVSTRPRWGLEDSEGRHVLGAGLGRAPLGGLTPVPLIPWAAAWAAQESLSSSGVPPGPSMRKLSTVLTVQERRKGTTSVIPEQVLKGGCAWSREAESSQQV